MTEQACTCDECPSCGSRECYIAGGRDFLLRCGNTGELIPDCPIHPETDPNEGLYSGMEGRPGDWG